MLLLAFGQPEFDFGKASLGKIDAEWDEREPLLLGLAEEFIDLLAVKEQLPGTEGFVIHEVAVTVRADVAMMEKGFAALHAGIAVLQVHAPVSDGFHLCALKHDARLEFFFDEIVMVGLAIRDHRFFEAVLFFSHQRQTLILQGTLLSAFRPEYSGGNRPWEQEPAADCSGSFCYDAAMRGLGRIDSISSILEGLARRLGLESKLLEGRLRRDWTSIVGEPLASNTWPDQIRYKKLYLLVHNSVWLHQLTFLKPTLLRTLNKVAGGELITDIMLRVGELPRAGRMPASPGVLSETPSSPGDALLAEVSMHVTAIQDPIIRDRLAQLMAQALAQPRASKVG
jgi:hypothetical protein